MSRRRESPGGYYSFVSLEGKSIEDFMDGEYYDGDSDDDAVDYLSEDMETGSEEVFVVMRMVPVAVVRAPENPVARVEWLPGARRSK